MRGEVADRVVAPVVGQAPVGEERLGHVLVHREQLDGGDTEVEEVGDGRLVGQPGVRATQRFRDVGVGRREALDVDLVDDRVGVPPAGRLSLRGPPVVVARHQAPRHVCGGVQTARRVGIAGHVAEHVRTEADLAADRAGVRVEQQFGRVAPHASGRVERARGAVPVRLSRGPRPARTRARPPPRDPAWVAGSPRRARRTDTAAFRPRSPTPRRSSCPRRGPWRREGTTGPAAPPARRSRLRLLGPRRPQRVADRRHRAVPAPDQVGHDPGPPGLVRRAEARAVVAVEVLAEDEVVLPGRVGLQPLDAAEAGPPPVRARP